MSDLPPDYLFINEEQYTIVDCSKLKFYLQEWYNDWWVDITDGIPYIQNPKVKQIFNQQKSVNPRQQNHRKYTNGKSSKKSI